jgi:hypothetical protein
MLLSGSTNLNLRVGYWRTHAGLMEIVSENNDRHVTHFKAPPSAGFLKTSMLYAKPAESLTMSWQLNSLLQY